MLGLNPYGMLGALVGAFLLCAASFIWGVHVTNDHWKATQLGVEKQVEAEKDSLTKKANDAEAALEAARNNQQVVYRDVIKNVDRVVEKPVYRNVCIDADGLRLVNSALANKAAAAAQPH